MNNQANERGEVGELLFEHHMIYQQKLRRVVTQKEFAEHIGLSDQVYNHIYRGRRKISYSVAKQLADFFDDLRFYEAAGFQSPDPRLHYVQRNWENLSDGVTKKIADLVTEYLGKKK